MKLKSMLTILCGILAVLLGVCDLSFAQVQMVPELRSSRSITTKAAIISLTVDRRPEGARFFKANSADANQPAGRHRKHYYAEMTRGTKYAINFEVPSGLKMLVCIAVDGITVMGNERVSDNFEELSAWNVANNCYVADETATIEGWRYDPNTNAIRRFKVTAPRNSVAAKFDDLSASGTIAIAIFREQSQEVLAIGPTRGSGSKGLGTGAGALVQSEVRKTRFEAAPTAAISMVIKYDTRETLQRLGVWSPEISAPQVNRLWPSDKR